jgi:hypothetical protein
MKTSRAFTLGTAILGLGLCAMPALAKLGDAAGVTGAVQGQAALESPARNTAIDPVQSGQDVVMGDAVSTRAQSRLQIMLLDQTAITMGENASLVIDEFVYDPASSDVSLTATVAQGAFRLVTGGVARNNPDGTKLKLPSAVLTIRGTTTQGNCDASGCIVVLGGTGDENSAGKRPSQITIESASDRKVLKRAGFFVLIRPDGSITDPEPLEDEAAQRLGALFDPLTGEGAGGGDFLGGQELINASGQPTADGRPFASDLIDINGYTIPLGDLGSQSTTRDVDPPPPTP